MAKENDAYAICTAQKKKSGMGHDAWKRCVDKVKKEESIMNFSERVRSIFEKRKLKNEGDEYDDIPDHEEEADDGGAAQAAADASLDASRKSRMKKKKLKEKTGGTNAEFDGKPEDESEEEAESELDNSDTGTDGLESKKESVNTRRNRVLKTVKEALGLNEDSDCTARANAVKARTGSVTQAQTEYNKCKKEKGDDRQDMTKQSNQDAERATGGFPKTGRSDDGPHEAKDWINKAADSIEDRGTEGKCTPITKKGCTGRAKALAKTFKKIGRKRDAAIVSKKEKAAKKK